MKSLATMLGCEYISRNDRSYAKAGNINNALTKTSGDLIAIFDADFIPTTNFLERSVGFFLDEKIAIVQTNQSYYNSDPIARNLGIQHLIPHEAEMFSSHYQLLRDGVGASGCYGTSVVIRKSSLEEVGGFVTDSITEDYFTGINISCHGYKIIYLNEKLSAGLSVEDMPSHLNQRLRWGRGTLQAFFLKSNPVRVKGLNLLQRITHLEGILHWFSSIRRICFFMVPVVYSFLNISLINAKQSDLLYFCLPYYLIYLASYSWLNHYTRSFLLSDLYSTIHCIPLAVNSIQAIINPFSTGFNVTPKGISRDNPIVNWSMIFPLLFILLLEFLSLFYLALQPKELYDYKYVALAWIFYNVLILCIAVISLIDAPKNTIDFCEVNEFAKIHFLNTMYLGIQLSGRLTFISENQALIIAENKGLMIDLPEKIEIYIENSEKELVLPGKLVRIDFDSTDSKICTMCIHFDRLETDLYRKLIEFIYCQPGRWKQKRSPNDWIWFSTLLFNLTHRKSQNRLV